MTASICASLLFSQRFLVETISANAAGEFGAKASDPKAPRNFHVAVLTYGTRA